MRTDVGCGADPRPAAARAPAGHAAAALPADVEPARFLSGGTRRGTRSRGQGEPAIPPATPIPIRRRWPLRASCARTSATTRLRQCGARLVPEGIVLLHAGAAAARRQSGGRLSLRDAPRLLRALCERLRRAAARGGDSGARGHRLSGRHDQSERRLHDRAPVRRPRLGRGAHRRAVAPLRPDGRDRTVPHPDGSWAARCPRAIRFRCSRASTTPSSRACSCRGTPSITTGAAT